MENKKQIQAEDRIKIMLQNIILKDIKSNNGVSITEITNNTKINRSSVRTYLAYLLGANKIKERRVGMAKLYYLK